MHQLRSIFTPNRLLEGMEDTEQATVLGMPCSQCEE
jgi:hypothetical protein